MDPGILVASVAAGLAVPAILRLKQQHAAEYLAAHGPLPGPATSKAVQAIVRTGRVTRGLDLNRRTRCCDVPEAQRGTDQRCIREGTPTPCRTTPHWGIDIGCPVGTPVYAAMTGAVVAAQAQGGYGYAIQVAHADGRQSTLYAHLSRMDVAPGQAVQAGQQIGLSGRSQFPPSGMSPHLHFEVHNTPTPRLDSTPRLDPATWLASHQIAVAASVAAEGATASLMPDNDTGLAGCQCSAGLGSAAGAFAIAVPVAVAVAVGALALELLSHVPRPKDPLYG